MFILFPIILTPCNASGLSTNLGQIVGYSYIGLTIFIVFCYGLVFVSRYKAKGTQMVLAQLIAFTQFSRYLPLQNFNNSSFFTEVWKTFSMSQDPYELLECSSSDSNFKQVGFESTNFLCNSLAHLIVICGLLILSGFILALFSSQKKDYLKDFWVFVIYASVTDLSLSGFIQIKHVKIMQLAFGGVLEVIGSVLGILYLAGILIFFCIQFYFLYHGRYELSVVRLIKEEFLEGKQYYFYCYFLFLLVKMLLYTFLLVFSQERPYATPIVICVMNLVICKLYIVSYLVSMKPYALYRTVIFLNINETIECMLVILPILYQHNTVSDSILDISSIGLFIVGMMIFCIRSFFDPKYENLRISIKNEQPSMNVIDDSINRSVDDLVKKTKEDLHEGVFVKTARPLNYNMNVNEKPKNIDNSFKFNTEKGAKPEFFLFPKHSDASVIDESEKFEEKTPNFYLPSESNASSKAINHFGNLAPHSEVGAIDNRDGYLMPPSRNQYNQGTPNILTPSSSSKQSFGGRSKLNLNNFTVRSFRGD
jgi:hypothetical protein